MLEFLKFIAEALLALGFIALMGYLGLLQWRVLRRERRNEQYLWAVLKTVRVYTFKSPKKLLRED